MLGLVPQDLVRPVVPENTRAPPCQEVGMTETYSIRQWTS